MRASTPTRIPPFALAAAAGLHALVGIAVLDLWQRSPAFDETQPVEIEVVMPAAAPLPEPEQEPTAEPQSEPPPPEPEIVAFDPAFIPEPEPPPPLVFEKPKPPVPKPTPPKPAA
ncbi:MAG: energy transducer TonB, partial [Reyranella sp.]|nr:energy transducer TonB [Reyranella sp.]